MMNGDVFNQFCFSTEGCLLEQNEYQGDAMGTAGEATQGIVLTTE